MRYDDFRRSDDIEDRRDDSGGGMGGGGLGLPIGGGGGLGIGTIIVLGLIGYAFGIDPRVLIGGARNSHRRRQPGAELSNRSPVGDGQDRRADRRDGQHDRRHSRRDRRSLERDFPGRGQILYRSDASCCSATPPMAAAAAWRSRRWGRSTARRTRQIFLDTGFFREVETRFHGCQGSACKFTAAYIIAHEAGHHIQNLLGILPKVTRAAAGRPAARRQPTRLQVRVELQADCLSGVWVNREEKKRPGFIEAGDIDGALADGVRDRRRHAAAAGDWAGGAGFLHPRLGGAAQALVHDRLSAGNAEGMRHVRRSVVVAMRSCPALQRGMQCCAADPGPDAVGSRSRLCEQRETLRRIRDTR